MAEQQGPLKTYRGNCHCAAFVYEISVPEIKRAFTCNCSICYKKGSIWVLPKRSDVKFVKGDPSTLTDYFFNKKQYAHNFCPTCGVSLMFVGHLKPLEAGEDRLPDYGFNLRTFQHGQVDVYDLETDTYDGKAIPPAYEPPKFTGPLPTGFDDLQLYTGSCHCGAVTLAMKSQPLDKDTKGLVECNCSICSRYGTPWTYPRREQVAIEGKENLTQYIFNKNIAIKNFCKICGVVVSSNVADLTDEEADKLDPFTRGFYDQAKPNVAISLRFIDGLDVQDLKPDRMDGYSMIQPGYVEP
ncbi:glutathione-dependent formaldehyde-activating enzyme [Xylaria bambusicola]|uniref:glutathione-dependent formaldehyde-activating enzyme n=1 Tax=Xylaria bambusicola TaxID=326684 RepID=UPI0020085EFD|nr:glutathione-dependent formaldehyde-activating enzyme [Xylaria bambusicola]KAI0509352.1 glutathione-dependent formaldehyde-activating enzyme [Xylaria bambusicola]